MAHIDAKKKKIQAKIVYYGPGLCGKTTNLEHVNKAVPNTQEMMSLSTEGDRTIFFDYLPMELGKIRGIDTTFKLYTVPGQVRYNRTRKMVLKNVDGVVFVADSQEDRFEANIDSYLNLQENLQTYKVGLGDLPHVIQYNKRDLDDIVPVEELRKEINTLEVPDFEAIALKGDGVFETLRTAVKLVIARVTKDLEL